MATFTRGSQSCTSIIFGKPNLATGENSLMPARSCNLEQTLKDLELMKNKKRFSKKSKSTSNINFPSTSCERRNSKTVRFENTGGNENYLQHAIRKAHSDEQIYMPLWMQTENLFCMANGNDIEYMNTGNLRRSQSESRLQCKKLKKKNILKKDSNLAEKKIPGFGTLKFFNKLKKFWQGMNGKQKTKQPNSHRRFLTVDDLDTKYSEISNSADSSSSCSESLKSETSGYATSKPQEVSSYLEAGESDDSLKNVNKKISITPKSHFQNVNNPSQYDSLFAVQVEHDAEKNGQLNLNPDVKTVRSKSFKHFWEPRNGFNDLTTTTRNGCDAYTPKHLGEKSVNGFTSNNEENISHHTSWNNVKDDIQCLTPQTSTDTLVNVCCYDCSIPSLARQQSKGSGFLNYKTSPICCSLDSNSSSCRDSENDTKKAIQSLKKAMAIRKKKQKLELKQLKEEMKFLKRRRSRKSGSSRSSSCTSSSATADYASLSNLLEASASSYSAAYSIISLNNSDEKFRTVMYEPYRDAYSSDNSKCSKLKQEYSLKSPIWSQPVLKHNQPTTQCSRSVPQTVYFEQPYKLNNQQPHCPRCLHPNETENFHHNDADCDPTRWLWKELLLNTPCDVGNANESIITCYVAMYRKQAEEARIRKNGCILDPLEFRYGYQNEKHSNGPVNVVKKGDAKIIWNCKKNRKNDEKCDEKQYNKKELPLREEQKNNIRTEKYKRKGGELKCEACKNIK